MTMQQIQPARNTFAPVEARTNGPMMTLVSFCRAYLDLEPMHAAPETDWEQVKELAAHHRLGPLIWRMLQKLPPGPVPAAVAEWFRQDSLETAKRNLLFTAELLRIDEAFKARDVLYAPNKGVVLAQELYGDVSMRAFGDLDLVVEPAAVARALAALHDLGYSLDTSGEQPPPTGLVLKFASNCIGELPLRHADKPVPLDLHWNILGRKPLRGYSLKDSLSEDTLTLSRTRSARFKPEDQFIFLSLHGFKHGWQRFNWLVDLACLLKKRGAFLNWPKVAERLDDTASVWLLSGLYLTDSLLGGGAFTAGDYFSRPVRTRAKRLAQRLARTCLSPPAGGQDDALLSLLPLFGAPRKAPWPSCAGWPVFWAGWDLRTWTGCGCPHPVSACTILCAGQSL
jgi:hypothetical protein